jgi:hypothetical protein
MAKGLLYNQCGDTDLCTQFIEQDLSLTMCHINTFAYYGCPCTFTGKIFRCYKALRIPGCDACGIPSSNADRPTRLAGTCHTCPECSMIGEVLCLKAVADKEQQSRKSPVVAQAVPRSQGTPTDNHTVLAIPHGAYCGYYRRSSVDQREQTKGCAGDECGTHSR